MARQVSFAEAIREALREEMARDPTVFVMGEDVRLAYVTGVTKGLVKEFGEHRVLDTPLSEGGFIGAALGAALTGARPVPEIMTCDFLTLCMDQITNAIAKVRYFTGGQAKSLPIVVRAPIGIWPGYASTHSQSLEAWFLHLPGVYVAVPSTPYDAKGLLKAAIRGDNPVIYFEHKQLYSLKGEVPDGDYTVPFGKARLAREGSDVTVVAYMLMVHKASAVAERLEGEGVSVEIVDLRTLSPLDRQAIVESVKKTNRAVVVEEGHRTGGVGGEITATIMEEAFDYLDAPVVRVAAPDVPIPYSPPLEKLYAVEERQIYDAIKSVVG